MVRLYHWQMFQAMLALNCPNKKYTYQHQKALSVTGNAFFTELQYRKDGLNSIN
jgi:hypothetical protein